jgi:hypothetical protein
MYVNTTKIKGFVLLFTVVTFKLSAQLSPGALSDSHSNLEGIFRCTQCHVLGNKVSNDKCLACHTEIQARLNNQKGYHSSSDVKGKECFTCHSEHNGKNFQLIRIDTGEFNHSLTGYSLSVPHASRPCQDCHNQKFISDQKLKTKKNTYLGLKTECLSCHTDYHQQTLSSSCLNCHNPESFKTAPKFNHDNARFQLAGKHKAVDCLKCHKKKTINGKTFQEFRGVQFNNCTSCHKDPHQDKFGQNCRQCHNEESFSTATKGLSNFDHNKTNFKLEEKHLGVSCTECHKTKFTDPLKYGRCTDCHSDYHNGQFAKNGDSPDCSQCHTVKGFFQSSYTLTQHNAGTFPLNGSHVAVPCFDCHKKQEKWNFRNIGLNCVDCHNDIHNNLIQAKYYPGSDCRVCHNENKWTEVSFDHSSTGFSLTGAHIGQECRACHFRSDPAGIIQQKFSGLSYNCTNCHKDIHYGQFEKNGITSCTDCHGAENWRVVGFDHNKTAFKLDGEHINVPCAKCHKPQQGGEVSYVRYKLKEFKCESCH